MLAALGLSYDESGDGVDEKRMRVLQLHIEELQRQSSTREAELITTQQKLRQFEQERASAQPHERRLFQRLEQLQTELKRTKEHRVSAEAQVSELTTQLDKVVDAAKLESTAPGERMLLRVTTEQLETTQLAMQQAFRQVADAELQASDANDDAKATREALRLAEERVATVERQFERLLQKSAQASLLQLPPPSKGRDLAEQHHILQLNYRHLQSELRQKVLAVEGLRGLHEECRQKLERRLPAQQEQQRKLRAELAQQRKEGHEQLTHVRDQLQRHVESLDEMRRAVGAGSGSERAGAEATRGLVRARMAAAVHAGALRGMQARATDALATAHAEVAQLRASSVDEIDDLKRQLRQAQLEATEAAREATEVRDRLEIARREQDEALTRQHAADASAAAAAAELQACVLHALRAWRIRAYGRMVAACPALPCMRNLHAHAPCTWHVYRRGFCTPKKRSRRRSQRAKRRRRRCTQRRPRPRRSTQRRSMPPLNGKRSLSKSGHARRMEPKQP